MEEDMNGDAGDDRTQKDQQPADPEKIKEAVKHAEERRGTKRGEDIVEKEEPATPKKG